MAANLREATQVKLERAAQSFQRNNPIYSISLFDQLPQNESPAGSRCTGKAKAPACDFSQAGAFLNCSGGLLFQSLADLAAFYSPAA